MAKKLKGSVNYGVFVWHSSDEACEKCRALNNKRFNSIEEIPDKPHPNCRCWVDIIDDEEEKELYEYVQDFDELISDAKSLSDEVDLGIAKFSDIYDNSFLSIKNIAQNIIDSLFQIKDVIQIFISNYKDMREANTIGADKYFHSKANCMAAQRGEIASILAKGMSELREITDSFKNVYFKGMTRIESEKDSLEDKEANDFGRNQGEKYKDENCSVLIDKYRPNGLSDQY